MKKMLVSFEKKVKKNQEMRIKYSDNPQKYVNESNQNYTTNINFGAIQIIVSFQRFLDSELDLHDEIQKLHVITTAPELYEVLVQQNVIQTILGLLSHENSDILCYICYHILHNIFQ